MTTRVLISEMRSTAKQYPRLFACVFFLAALLFAFRLFVDFWVPRSDAFRAFAAPQVKIFPASASREWVFAKIDGWFPVAPTDSGAEKVVERQIQLQAVYGERSQLKAVFLLKSEGAAEERLTVMPGGVVEGWTLKEVQRKRVILLKGDLTRELVLFPAKSGSG